MIATGQRWHIGDSQETCVSQINPFQSSVAFQTETSHLICKIQYTKFIFNSAKLKNNAKWNWLFQGTYWLKYHVHSMPRTLKWKHYIFGCICPEMKPLKQLGLLDKIFCKASKNVLDIWDEISGFITFIRSIRFLLLRFYLLVLISLI